MSKYEYVKTWIHDERIYQEPTYTMMMDVDNDIKQFARDCLPIAKEVNADHFVYATKIYEVDGDEEKLIELNYYNIPLDDEEFSKRTGEVYEDCIRKGQYVWFGVLHKGTAY